MDCCKFSYFSDKDGHHDDEVNLHADDPRNLIWNRKNSDKVFCIYPKNSGAGAFKVKL